MRAEVYGEGDRDLVFVLGWTNKPSYANIRWLLDHLVGADFRVHAIEIPRVASDFDAEYLDPVAGYVDDLGTYRVLSHSTGGLISAFLGDPETRVYLSPWWGFHEDHRNLLLSLLMRIPTRRTILPASFTGEMLGDLAKPDQVEDLPDGIAPTFLRESRRAQARLPPVDPADVVFYTPEDPIVDSATIRERTPEANLVAYQGGHDFFNSSARDTHLDTLLSAVEAGAEALE